MMNSKMMNVGLDNDAELVAASLSGDRAAFGRIVSRYQSLVCSVTYSATGNLTLSEDVAQETFVTAWRQLADLREPAKLKSWLCGIARNLLNNTLRRLGREPSQAGETLDAAAELSSPEEAPGAQTIRREEEAILWQSLERIPELYRAPLILFYREGCSVEQTATLLDLSEDVVRQRLTRGRKQLADEVTAFVEGTLRRSAPSVAFASSVLAALPPMVVPATIGAIGGTAKGGLGAKAVGLGAVLSSLILSPLLVIFGNYTSYRMSLEAAASEQERASIRSFYRKLLVCSAAVALIFPAAIMWLEPLSRLGSVLSVGLAFGVVMLGTGTIFLAVVQSFRRRRRMTAGISARPDPTGDALIVYEYRSRTELLGWPLVHVRLRSDFAGSRAPVKAWIAVGDCAVGLLFAYGGFAIAPVSVGGVAFGLIGFGGCAMGLLGLGACAAGFWAWGGVAIGWQAYGGLALAWHCAVGGVALAREFAVGIVARGAQANTDAANQFVLATSFWHFVQALRPYSVVMNLIWVAPLALWRWAMTRHARRMQERLEQPR